MRRYVSRRAWLIYPRGSQLTASSLNLFIVCVCVMGKKRSGDRNSGLGKTILKERSRRKRTKGQSWVCCMHCLSCDWFIDSAIYATSRSNEPSDAELS